MKPFSERAGRIVERGLYAERSPEAQVPMPVMPTSGGRTLITGYPKTGKTMLATKMGGGRSTDETIEMGLDWSAGSAEVVNWLREPYTIIEGVAVPRALRKYHDLFPDEPPPVDKIIRLMKQHQTLDNRQIGMGKGIDKVWNEILPWLKEYGVEIEER